MKDDVQVLGTDTCKDTTATRTHLAALGVDYRYVDIEEDDAAARRVEELNGGERKTPTVVLRGRGGGGGEERVLSVPSDTELDAELDRRGLVPTEDRGDGSPGLDRR